MKTLIIQALNDALIKLDKITPQTKKIVKQVNIDNVKPLDIVTFMKENDIPDTAYFGGKENSYDAFNEICLCYDINIPTTDKDKLIFKRHRFSTIAFKSVYDLLTSNGFKRVGFNSGLLKEFNDTTVYDLFINNEFDRLVKYYSLSFSLIETF